MIKADVMAIHFNALHELFQEKGDKTFNNLIENFKELKKIIKIPIIAKEVGSGFSQEVAQTLDRLGFDGFDVGGAGGTSFAAIESYRNKSLNERFTRNPAELFRDWGIPTPTCIIEVGEATNWKLPIIATGGIRSGLDVARAIALGANCAGIAHALLNPAIKGSDHTLFEIDAIIKELRAAMFLVGADKVSKMKNIGVDLWI